MSENEFTLLNHLQKSKSKIEKIKEQRFLVKKTLGIKNDLVQQIWEIDLKLAKLKKEDNEDDVNVLKTQKKELLEQLESGDYSNKIKEHTQAIHDLEVEVYGASDVGGNSPYRL